MHHINPLFRLHSFLGRLAAVFILAFMFAATAKASVVLIIDSTTGKLTGATGVVVGGDVYNVAFRDGSCIDLFGGCDDPSDFAFNTQPTARDASNALLNFVFLDGTTGDFDSDPSRIAGCESTVFCSALTPFSPSSTFVVFDAAPNFDNIYAPPYINIHSKNYSLQGDVTSVYAVWIKASSAPEPSSVALLGLAGFALGWSQRRRRLRANERVQ